MGAPSLQSQYHRMPFTNGVVIQPMMPDINASISKISQGSIYLSILIGLQEPVSLFKASEEV